MFLVPPSLRHNVIRAGYAVLLALPLFLGSSSVAYAKTPKNCRDIELKGAAGVASQDTVRFRIRDSAGTLLDQSCPLQVRFGESDVQFTQRLPGFWGVTGGTVCTNPGPGPTPAPGPTPRDNKTCSAGGLGYACKHEYRTTAGALPTDPPIQTLRVCCWRSADPGNCTQGVGGTCCSGKKINAADKKLCTKPLANVGLACTTDANCDTSVGSGDGRCGRAPITVQTQVQSNPYSPSDSNIPFTGTTSAQLVIDPIGVIQRPSPATQGCRGSLGKAMSAYAAGRASATVKCENQDLASANGCDTDQRDAILDKLETTFRATVDSSCVPLGPPRRLGYAACPSPCESNVISTCTAGLGGHACASDTDCDTSLNAGDGVCGPGSWDVAKDCLVCLTEDATDQAVDAAFGNVTGPLAPNDEQCQLNVGNVIADLINVQTKQNAKCQKTVDGGKTPLVFCEGGVCTGPPESAELSCTTSDDCLAPANQLCKFADPAGERANREAGARAQITTSCANADFANLDTCGSDPATEADCIIHQARDVGRSLADAVFPEGIGHDLP